MLCGFLLAGCHLSTLQKVFTQQATSTIPRLAPWDPPFFFFLGLALVISPDLSYMNDSQDFFVTKIVVDVSRYTAFEHPGTDPPFHSRSPPPFFSVLVPAIISLSRLPLPPNAQILHRSSATCRLVSLCRRLSASVAVEVSKKTQR